jgi:hypothetical protein
VDVEQEHLRAARGHALHRLEPIARLAGEAGRHLGGDVAEQRLQPLARRLLVVGDEYADQAPSGR